jgi:hypothetical protein
MAGRLAPASDVAGHSGLTSGHDFFFFFVIESIILLLTRVGKTKKLNFEPKMRYFP